MIKVAPDGKEHSPAGYVFGDAVGGHVADPKKTWATTCRNAGITDLHFDDLWHEAGSRLLEAAPSRARDVGTRRPKADEHVSERNPRRTPGLDEAVRRLAH